MDILIYNDIGRSFWDDNGITGESIAKELNAVPSDEQKVDVRINSLGGSVSEGFTIRNQLMTFAKKRRIFNSDFKLRTIVDGYAYSAASIVAMAGDEVIMNTGTMMMIHCTWTWTSGNAADLLNTSAYLDKLDGELAAIFAAKTEKKVDVILELMKAETYFTPQEAKKTGLIDTIDQTVTANLALHGEAFSSLSPMQFQRAFKERQPKQAAASGKRPNFSNLRRMEAELVIDQLASSRN